MAKYFRKWCPLVLFVTVSYVLYSFFILSPEKYTSFSLIDDGQTIQNSKYFNDCIVKHECSSLENVLIEKEFGRVRPVYWFIHYINLLIIGLNAQVHHLVRVYVVGLTLIFLITLSVIRGGGKFFGIVLATISFFTSFSFTENMLRLGPVEPYQVIIIGLFSLIYLGINFKDGKTNIYLSYILLAALLIIAILIKETSIVLAVSVLVTYLFLPKGKKESLIVFSLLIISLVVTALGRGVSHTAGGELAYVENFTFNARLIFSNSVSYYRLITGSYMIFARLAIIFVPLSYIVSNLRYKFIDRDTLYWLFMFVLSTGLLLPWKYVLERYIFLSLYCLSILVGIVASKILGSIQELINRQSVDRKSVYLVNSFILILLTNLIFINSSLNFGKTFNFTYWYRDFLLFESDQVKGIASIGEGNVYINAVENLNNWEVLYELPIHLKLIENSTVHLELLPEQLPRSGYIFTRIPFDSKVDDSALSEFELIASGTYHVRQIDILKFNEMFILRPISTVLSPPLLEKALLYNWEIREI